MSISLCSCCLCRLPLLTQRAPSGAEKIRAIATRFDLDADAVLDNVSPCLCGFSIKYCSGMHTGDVDDEGDACMRRSSMPGRTRMRRR